MTINSPRFNLIIIAAVLLVAVLEGMQSLDDPDLGTHLAAGLWILDTHSLPTRDPFGAQGNFWLCYSWLPEVLMGSAYWLGGFYGVKVFSTAFFVAMAAGLILVVQAVSATAAAKRRGRNYLGEWLSLGAVLPLILPFCRLRPQVASWLFFAVLIAWADRDRLRARYLVPLTIVWANVHVYWLLVPLIVLLHRGVAVAPRRLAIRWQGGLATIGYFLLGLLNPYGWRLFTSAWEYVFAHETADALISEFAPFVLVRYEFFWLYLAILLVAGIRGRMLLVNERPGHVATFAIFAVAALIRIKYSPLFALSAVPILRTVFGDWLARVPAAAPAGGASRVAARWQVPLLAAVAFVLGVALVYRQPLLPGPERELFEIARRLQEKYPARGEGPVTVLTDYNYSGWLILALWLDRPPGAHESRFKVAIDGRTHVVGQQRLAEYYALTQLAAGWPEIFASWQIQAVVLPSRARLVEVLHSGSEPRVAELGEWAMLYRSVMWTVLVRQPRSGSA